MLLFLVPLATPRGKYNRTRRPIDRPDLWLPRPASGESSSGRTERPFLGFPPHAGEQIALQLTVRSLFPVDFANYVTVP